MADYTCKAGDTLKLRVQVYTSAERRAPFVLTGSTLEFRAVDRAASPLVTVEKSIGAGIVVTNALLGEFEVTLSPTDTRVFGDPGGVLLFYVRLVSGIDVYTVGTGRVVIQRLI